MRQTLASTRYPVTNAGHDPHGRLQNDLLATGQMPRRVVQLIPFRLIRRNGGVYADPSPWILLTWEM